MQLIHTDIWGASPLVSTRGFRYYVHFTDDFTRFSWFYLLSLKSEAFDVFLQFKTMVENQFDCKIKSIQSDEGGEFTSNKFTKFLHTHGILQRLSCPYTHEQNGLAVRKHRHIVETGLTLIAHSSMPLKYWDYAFQTAIYLINRLPTPLLGNLSPMEKLLGKSPDYKSLRVFGCACYPFTRPMNQNKLQFRSIKSVFLGYSSKHKRYLCLTSNGKVLVSRHVVFNESEFPFAVGFPHPSSSSVLSSSSTTSPLSSYVPFFFF